MGIRLLLGDDECDCPDCTGDCGDCSCGECECRQCRTRDDELDAEGDRLYHEAREEGRDYDGPGWIA